jgi:hypothetical protein
MRGSKNVTFLFLKILMVKMNLLNVTVYLNASTTLHEVLLLIGITFQVLILVTTKRNIFRDFFFLVYWGEVRLSPVGTSASNWPIVSAPDDR